jgi:CDP-paratose 2-epimerase
MSVIIVTGSAGLVGSEATRHFAALGAEVHGIDNDMRARFFGAEASTRWNAESLKKELPRYRHHELDIRDQDAVEALFKRLGSAVSLVVHAAAQPSHDWAARDPYVDFDVNARGTLNMLESTRRHSPDAVFIHMSTNKVYGDLPNGLPLVEQEKRWEIAPGHAYADGIDESMSIDASTHSLFGVSKVAGDVLAQEYGRYFGMRTGVFRGGCLTGPKHSGAQLHGFLAYLMKCAATGTPYTVFGYKGKQVRDNIHSADLVAAFEQFYRAPRPGEAYNMGGGRFSNCSMLEAIGLCEEITGRKLEWEYSDKNRIGDHIWYVSGLAKFMGHYPAWRLKHDLRSTLTEMYESNREKWRAGVGV